MKKIHVSMLLSVLAVIAGVLLKPVSRFVCGCLVIGGLISFFILLACWALTQTEKRCPACGQRIHVSIGQHGRVRSGLIPCPRCGALVRVDHVTPR